MDDTCDGHGRSRQSSPQPWPQHARLSPPTVPPLPPLPSLSPLATLAAILVASHLRDVAALQRHQRSATLHAAAAAAADRAREDLRRAREAAARADAAEADARAELEATARDAAAAREAHGATAARATELGRQGVARRAVRLVGLRENAAWNGKRGTVMALVTEGEDLGRWKVRLDGGDDGGVNGDGDCGADRGDERDEEGSSNIVVAKADNLQLLEDRDARDTAGSDNGRSNHRSLSRSLASSSRRGRSRSPQDGGEDRDVCPIRSRDPEEEQRPSRPTRDPSLASCGGRQNTTRTTTRAISERKITPTSYYKSKHGQYHEQKSRSPPPRHVK